RGAQAGRTGARVTPGLFHTGLARAAMKQFETGCARLDGRQMARAARRGPGALTQESLDDAVLERMEGDHGQSASGRQDPLRRGQSALELAQLVVHVETQRLEAARRRVDAIGRGLDHPTN